MFLLSIVVVILTACNSSEQLKPIKVETIDFDINSAIEMVEEKERIIIDFALKEKLPITEFEEFEKSLTEEFGNHHAKDILSMFFDFGTANNTESKMYVLQDTFYPTVFHEGIIVTNAVIYKSYYENDFFNQTRLEIREEYIGDDEKLEGWNREYIFIQNKDDGEWEINGFSGVMNYAGEEFNMNYLKFKQ